jgi:redox-sensing transcriptional repressor
VILVVEKEISRAVVKRLPRYYRYLGDLLESGVERISSGELSERMQVTASQIRQDLNNFGGFGQQGYGYNVKFLYNEIGKILGLDKTYHMIIVGAGNLGQALANYVKFEKRGFWIKGIFDVNPRLQGVTVRGIEIRMTDEIPQFVKEHNIQIAALTLPRNNAAQMAELLVENGVKAIWNFAHTDLRLPEDVIVENVHLSESLMQLSYNINRYQREHEKKLNK